MWFEVFNRENQRVLYCYDVSCIPSKEELTHMQAGKYKFKLDGKRVTIAQLQTLKKKK